MEEGFAEDIFLILAGNELAVYGFTSRSALLTQLNWSVLPLPPPGVRVKFYPVTGGWGPPPC